MNDADVVGFNRIWWLPYPIMILFLMIEFCTHYIRQNSCMNDFST